jgi:threonine synthase
VEPQELAILDATAHALKFAGFQDMYFSGTLPAEYNITPNPALANLPKPVLDDEAKSRLAEDEYTRTAAGRVVEILGLSARQ